MTEFSVNPNEFLAAAVVVLFVGLNVNRKVEEMFVIDFKHSREVPSDELASKPWWVRFLVQVARLTLPIQ